MKEAAGEANMTVITIVLIGVVAAVGVILIPRLMNTVQDKSCCQELGGYVSGSSCVNVKADGTQVNGQSTAIGGLRAKCN